MSIVVEDGTGLSNSESYLSVSNADTYHSNRSNSAWTGSDASKESALRKATDYLDATYNWKGSIFSTTQSLNWPRVGVIDRNGRDLDYSVPKAIKDATAELALVALSEDLLPNTSNDDYVKREKVEGLEIEYKDGSPTGKEYLFVSRILAGLFTSKNGGNSVSLTRV